jgi:septum formation protein
LSLLYLASKSSRRKQILRKMKIPFKVVKSAYRESASLRLTPSRLTIRHAVGKANKAKTPRQARFILGADTTVFCQGRIFGKPKDLAAAKRTLLTLSGRKHIVYTGLALRDLDRGTCKTAIDKTDVFIKTLSKEQIERYFKRVTPFDKAGAYAIQVGPKIVTRIRGSYSNVMGLPTAQVRRLLAKSGFNRQGK